MRKIAPFCVIVILVCGLGGCKEEQDFGGNNEEGYGRKLDESVALYLDVTHVDEPSLDMILWKDGRVLFFKPGEYYYFGKVDESLVKNCLAEISSSFRLAQHQFFLYVPRGPYGPYQILQVDYGDGELVIATDGYGKPGEIVLNAKYTTDDRPMRFSEFFKKWRKTMDRLDELKETAIANGAESVDYFWDKDRRLVVKNQPGETLVQQRIVWQNSTPEVQEEMPDSETKDKDEEKPEENAEQKVEGAVGQ